MRSRALPLAPGDQVVPDGDCTCLYSFADEERDSGPKLVAILDTLRNELGLVVAVASHVSPTGSRRVYVVHPSGRLGCCADLYLTLAPTGPVEGAPSGSRRGPPIKAP